MSRELLRVAARCAALMAVAGAVADVVWLCVGDTMLALIRQPAWGTALTFEASLSAACSLALTGCAAWLLLVTGLACFEALTVAAGQTRTTRGSRLCPTAVRRLALGCGGFALATGLTCTPAQSDLTCAPVQSDITCTPVQSDSGGSGGPRTGRVLPSLTGLVLPDRTAETGGPVATRVRVHRGDCLWTLAEDSMPPSADASEVTAAVHAIHRANADQIGDDPDLIFPGTSLHIPTPT